MKESPVQPSVIAGGDHWASRFHVACRILALIALLPLAACHTPNQSTGKDDYFTSGSGEADQRASQRMAKQRQMEGIGNRGKLKQRPDATAEPVALVATDDQKVSLYLRLGEYAGLETIVRDFLPRVLEDPRVNWKRAGVPGRFTSVFNRAAPTNWQPTPANLTQLEQHLVQFLSLATGGPSNYAGAPLRSGHAMMRITNAEFDAAIGDIKASLDKLQIPNREQKELLSVVESTRPMIVTER